MSTETAPTRTYFGWQQEKVAFLFGLSVQRAAMLGGAVLAAIWPFAISYVRAGIVTWPLSLLLFLLAYVRIAGRTVDEWAVAFVSFEILRFRGQNRFLSGAFAPRNAATDEPKMDLPGILAPLAILEADSGSGDPIAVIHHQLDRTFTAVAKVRFPGIGLVDSHRRDQRVANWGELLNSQCTEGNAIIRIQALQRLVPESGAALQRWHTDHVTSDAPTVAVDITKSLLSTATLATSQREAYLAITMDATRAAGPIKAAGGGNAGAATVLIRHLRALTSSIASADLQVESWLNPANSPRSCAPPSTPTAAGCSQSGRQQPQQPSSGDTKFPLKQGSTRQQRARPLPRAGAADTSTTAPCRSPTTSSTGPRTRSTRPPSPRSWAKASTADRSTSTLSPAAPEPPNAR